jgi:pectate lyase
MPFLIRVLLAAGLFAFSGGGLAAAEAGPIGWASVDGGTTGGAAGKTVDVSDFAALVSAAKEKAPLVIRIHGTIAASDTIDVASHKTLLGVGADAVLEGGGLHIKRAENVIVRNLAIRKAPDGIGIEMESHHIWVDHCDLSACKDGLLDVKRGSDFVTVSWCRFHDHHKTALIGHSDKPDIRALDTGHLRVTYHHNWFDGTKTRHPRIRFAEPVHIFNNLYVGCEYGVASLMDAGTVVEGNVFEDVEQPTLTKYGDSPDPGRLVQRNNKFVKSGEPEAAGTVQEPSASYAYKLEDVETVAATVRARAGVGKLGE